jgi:rRNA maturation protein Nop10
MKQECDKCKKKTVRPKPAKYSPKDKYAEYRRKAKKQTLIKKDLL